MKRADCRVSQSRSSPPRDEERPANTTARGRAAATIFNTAASLLPVNASPGDWTEEILASGASRRPTVTIVSDDPERRRVVLGRNQSTLVTDTAVSRALCEVYVEPPADPDDGTAAGSAVLRCRMLKRPGCHRVCVDGRRVETPLGESFPLSHGSKISLHDRKYEYEVRILREESSSAMEAASSSVDDATETPARESSPPPSAPSSASCGGGIEEEGATTTNSLPCPIRAAKRLMVEELTCPVCMEILFSPRVANPCGHFLCGSCASDLTDAAERRCKRPKTDDVAVADPRADASQGPIAECPSCREGVMSLTRVRTMENLVWSAVMKGEFDEEDAKVYLEKSGRTPSEAELKCIFPTKAADDATQSQASSGTAATTSDPRTSTNGGRARPTFPREAPPPPVPTIPLNPKQFLLGSNSVGGGGYDTDRASAVV